MSEKAKALADHYQNTYELTYSLWQQRNRTFLLLLAVIGIATLLTFRAPQADSLLVDYLAKWVGVSDDPVRLAEIRRGFPFGLLQSILLIIVFYLMVNLYHRAVYVLRNYRYLACLEKEIRGELALAEEAVSFTRESSFYWSERSRLSGFVKWVYIAMLGLLLLAFLGGRIWDDFQRARILALVDLAIAVPTLVFFWEFARSSVGLDTAEVIVGGKQNSKRDRGSA